MKKIKAKITDKKSSEQEAAECGYKTCTDSKSLGAFKIIKETCNA